MVDGQNLSTSSPDFSGRSPQQAARWLLDRELRFFDGKSEDYAMLPIRELIGPDHLPELLFHVISDGSVPFSDRKVFGPRTKHIDQDFAHLRESIHAMARTGRADRSILKKGETVLISLILGLVQSEILAQKGINPIKAATDTAINNMMGEILYDKFGHNAKEDASINAMLGEVFTRGSEFLAEASSRTGQIDPNRVEDRQLDNLLLYRSYRSAREVLKELLDGLCLINQLLGKEGPGRASRS